MQIPLSFYVKNGFKLKGRNNKIKGYQKELERTMEMIIRKNL